MMVDRSGCAKFDDGESRILDQAPRRNSQTEPFVNITVGANGDFSTFSPELLGTSSPRYPTFTLGNVHKGGFLSSVEREPFRSLWADIRRGSRGLPERVRILRCLWRR